MCAISLSSCGPLGDATEGFPASIEPLSLEAKLKLFLNPAKAFSAKALVVTEFDRVGETSCGGLGTLLPLSTDGLAMGDDEAEYCFVETLGEVGRPSL